jgi:Raf kinase inhibitor-like YbhB/YbcL family protein
MKIISEAFKNETLMDVRFTCNGENVNPSLEFVDVPEEAVSLVLIMDDPDVPAQVREDRLWVHWVKFNIPVTTRIVEENSEPEGVSGVGTGGNLKYHGPCPPDRQHRYFFKLYALDTMLDLSEGSTKKEVEQAMKGCIIEQAELIGLYEQPDEMKTM